MNYTLDNAPSHIIKNIENLQKIWKQRCNAIEKNKKGDYSRHLLFVLNDLREEIENNKEKFSNNPYARIFFKLQISNYCSYCTVFQHKISELDKIKRKWAKKVDEELRLIAKILGGEFVKNSFDKIENWTTHINDIINKLISDSHFQKTIDFLCENLYPRTCVDEQIKFLVDTLIILFNSRGKLQIDIALENQLETIQELEYIERTRINFKHLIGDLDTYLYPKVWGSPSFQNGQSPNEYKEQVKNYYSNLTIKQRLDFLKNVYCQVPGSYKVIFHIQGWDFPESFSIGEIVEFYNSKTQRYIRNGCKRNKSYSENFNPDPNDFEIKTSFCLAVHLEGVDTKSMVIKARKIAERTIGLILTDKIDKHNVILSNDWIICNSQGEICNFEMLGTSNIRHTKNNEITAEFNKYDRNRLSKWISLENEYCVTIENKYGETIRKFFYSIDWYRQSVESSQSSQQILNSWFAMEMFRQDSKRLPDPKSFPSPSEKLLKKYNIKETQGCWLSKDIEKLQLILVLSKLKFNLLTKVRDSGTLLYRDIYAIDNIDEALTEEILRGNYQNEREWLSKILEILPNIQQKLRNENKELKYINNTNEIFQKHQQCEEFLFNEILELKDDVYNIYRIRNMLVHSGNTESKLLDYYAKRSLEYCDAILDIIAYKIFQTSSDTEIKTLEEYFQEILEEAEIAIQFVKENKMDKFRDWVLS
jgi:hypothetical protein